MKKKLAEESCDIHVYNGDTVTVMYEYENEDGLIESKKIATHEIKKPIHITIAQIWEFKEEFDLKEGYAGIIGKK